MSRRQLFQWPNDPRQALFKKIFIALLLNSCYNVKKQTIKGDGRGHFSRRKKSATFGRQKINLHEAGK
ncbi:hypothetical protein BFP49_12710 [Bacillus licheniformis]|nr:hypothetical protein BFP49_12710 [Bacillus licheniformis]